MRHSSHFIPTALSPPHHRFHVLHRMLQAVGSNKQHNDPSVRTHPGIHFILVQRAWRFERRAVNRSCLPDQISKSVSLCREPHTASSSSSSSSACVSSECHISTHPSAAADTEDVGFSLVFVSCAVLEIYLIDILSHVHSNDMCPLQPDVLYSPSLAVHMHIRTVFGSGCWWLCCRYGPGGIAAPADFPSFHPVDRRTSMTDYLFTILNVFMNLS